MLLEVIEHEVYKQKKMIGRRVIMIIITLLSLILYSSHFSNIVEELR